MRQLLLGTVIGALVPLTAPRAGDQGFDKLVPSMAGNFRVNVEATIVQRLRRSSRTFERIKVIRSKSGKQHLAVIEPLTQAGSIESVDDGHRWLMYIPDERLLIDQDSPSRANGDLQRRIDLARHNYTFRSESHADVAGRTVICVTAQPRHDELDTRRYCLDQQTAYPLRLETVSPDGDASLVFDTKDVEFPDELPAGMFEMHPGPGVTKMTYDSPHSLSPSEAKRILGFIPIVPRKLPLGFRVQETQYSEGRAWKHTSVRLTDGLIHVNVYQWLPDGKPKKPMADSTEGECNGIKLLLVSDSLGSDLREELLEAFTDGD